MIGFIVGTMVGGLVGFVWCALLSANKKGGGEE